jgi:hypothetical protein
MDRGWESEKEVQSSRFKVQGSRFKDQGSRIKVQGSKLVAGVGDGAAWEMVAPGWAGMSWRTVTGI